MRYAPVYAAAAGTVMTIGYLPQATLPKSASGMLVQLLHNGNAYRSLYVHLSAVLVQENQQVTKGQRIGTSGWTGLQPSHPHLHFEACKGACTEDHVFDPYGWEPIATPDPWQIATGIQSIRVLQPGLWIGQPTPTCGKINTGGPYYVTNQLCPPTCGQPLYVDDTNPPPYFVCNTCGSERYRGYNYEHKIMPVTTAGGVYADWFIPLPPGSYKVEISIPQDSVGKFPHYAHYEINSYPIKVSQFDLARSRPRDHGFKDWLDVGIYSSEGGYINVRLVANGNGQYLSDDPANSLIVDAVRVTLICNPTPSLATPTSTPTPTPGRGEPSSQDDQS